MLANFGTLDQLRVNGFAFGRHLERIGWAAERRIQNYGSIVVVVATDAPLTPSQLGRVARRAALGVGRCGSTANHGSGEIVLPFSTGNAVPRDPDATRWTWTIIPDRRIDPIYAATVDATEEAILNALFAGESCVGRNGRRIAALPVDEWRAVAARMPR